jgi:hypothetical protein
VSYSAVVIDVGEAEEYDWGYGGDDFNDRPKFEDLTWTTKEGKSILICHLDDDHLSHIVRMLRRYDKIVPYQMEMEIAHRKLKV